MRTETTRRRFIIGAAAAAAAPALLRFARERNRRILIDPCNMVPLPGVKMRIVNLRSGREYRVRTSADGSWDLSVPSGDVVDPRGEPFRARISARHIGGTRYAGLDYRMVLTPDGRNPGAGHLALLPLEGAGRALSVADADFEAAWPHLLRDAAFARERTPELVPAGLDGGAVTRFAKRALSLRLGASLSEAERAFVAEVAVTAVDKLSAQKLRLTESALIPLEGEPFFEDELEPAALTVIKRDTYPKPAVRLKHSDANPHEINAALIVLDNFTLNQNFREGLGSELQLAMARHLVQRAVADALGYRPTVRLPGRTVLDATFDPPGGVPRREICPEDELLARALYGSGCLEPGTRWSTDGATLVTDPRHPQG